METYKTSGTCAREIKFDVNGDKVNNVEFVSGCPGNLLGIQALVEGLTMDEIIEKFEGIKCGFKNTSCPDQFAKALKEYKANN
jgi:uncharacterized protein (TIGR03905 family)